MSNVIEILRNLVKYDTRTNETTPGSEVKLLFEKEIEPILRNHGFDVEYFESNGHFSLLGIRKGSSPSILYSGHVDVVPWDNRWSYPPQEITKTNDGGEDVIIGRGVCDMKGGIAALMSAVPKLTTSEATLIFAITGDEEVGGQNGTKVIVDYLVSENLLPDFVITADAAGMEIITRRRNVFDVIINAKKKTKKIRGIKEINTFHSSITSSKTSHAAYFRKEIDKHCLKLAADFLREKNAIPVKVTGNFVKVNVIPDSIKIEYVIPSAEGEDYIVDEGLFHLFQLISQIMEIDFDTEAKSDYGINSTANVIEEIDTYWRMQVDIRAMLSEQAVELEGALLLLFDDIPFDFEKKMLKSVGYIATPEDSPLVSATTNILGELGYSSKSAERGGATDGRFFAQHDIHTIDVGAIGWNVHGPDETVTVKSLQDLVLFFEKSSHAIYKDFHTRNR